MKKVSCIITSAALLALCGCSSSAPASSSVKEESAVSEVTEETKEPEAAEETAAPAAEITYVPGSVNGSVYESETAGIGVDLPGWTYGDAARLAEMNKIEDGTAAGLLNRMETDKIVMDMYAEIFSGDLNANINIQVQDLSSNAAILSYSEKEICDNIVDTVKSGLSNAGYTDAEVESIEVTFAGGIHGALKIHGTYQDLELHQKEIVLIRGNYLTMVTITAQSEEAVDEIMAKFYKLG